MIHAVFIVSTTRWKLKEQLQIQLWCANLLLALKWLYHIFRICLLYATVYKKHNCTWKSKIQDKNVCALLLTTNSKSVNLYLPRFIIMSFLVSLSCLGMHPRSALLFHLVRTSCILEAPLWRGLVVLMVDTIFHLQILILLQLPLNRVLHFVYVF